MVRERKGEGRHAQSPPRAGSSTTRTPLKLPQIRNAKSQIPNPKAFTLIELLVVIAVIALVMAILLPVLGRVRSQARAVVCQSNLRQWGVVFSIYMNENDGKSFSPLDNDRWPYTLRAYYGDSNDLLLCPVATRYEETPDPRIAHRPSVGSTSLPWKLRTRRPERLFCGSYGVNEDFPGYCTRDYLHPSVEPVRVSPTIPVLLDCISPFAHAWGYHAPPEYEGEYSSIENLKHYCIDRHDAHVNGLFLNASVRKIGLKELWILDWNWRFDTAGPWTKAGGVEPGDWPKWMRQFKEY